MAARTSNAFGARLRRVEVRIRASAVALKPQVSESRGAYQRTELSVQKVDLMRQLDVARARRDEWILRRMRAQEVGDHGLVKDADRIIADREDIIADLERALAQDGQS